VIVGVISDTHDKLSAVDAAFSFFRKENVEHIIHCGDWKSLETLQYFINLSRQANIPVSAVLGNNDYNSKAMMELAKVSKEVTLKEGVFKLNLRGKRCAIYHGHHSPTLRKVAESDEYDVLFLGHTHKPRISLDHKLIINPGSVAFSIPRSKAFMPTVAILDTVAMKAALHEITSL
jgi:uncharacterized protein